MLRVTLEKVPFGQEDQKRTIGSFTISNAGTGRLGMADYDVEFPTHKDMSPFRVKIKNYPRLLGAWELVFRSVRALYRKGALIELNRDLSVSRLSSKVEPYTDNVETLDRYH